MSFVIAAPEQVRTAAGNLASLHSTLDQATASAAAPTTGVAAAAQDEISAAIAGVFNQFGQEYQAVNTRAQAFHLQFVDLLKAGAGAYLGTEAANVRQILSSAPDSTRALFGPSGGTVAGAGGGAFGAFASGAAVARSATWPVFGIGGFGIGGSVASVLGGVGAGTPVGGASLLSGPNGTGLPALPGAERLLQSAASTGAAAGPYEMLLQNTAANLQAFGAAIAADPNPFFGQFLNDLKGYGNQVAAQLEYVLQNFPAVLAGAPASIQAGIQGLLAYNPVPYAQQIITNQMIYAELAYSSLQSAGGYFTAGLQALPSYLQSALDWTLKTNYTAAQGALFQGVLGLLFAPPGVAVTGQSGSLNVTYKHYSLFPLNDGNLPTSVTGSVDAGIVPVGTLGSLLPILTIPGMEAQNVTNLLPGGSIAQQVAQNFTNVVKTISDSSITLGGDPNIALDWGNGSVFPSKIPPVVTGGLNLNAHLGLPVALALDAAGGPVNAWDAFNASADAFNNAALSGHYSQAASALFAAPADITNAFLNGQSTLPLTTEIDGVPVSLNFPVDGVLVGPTEASLGLAGAVDLPIGGTPISGILPGFYYASQQLAAAITP